MNIDLHLCENLDVFNAFWISGTIKYAKSLNSICQRIVFEVILLLWLYPIFWWNLNFHNTEGTFYWYAAEQIKEVDIPKYNFSEILNNTNMTIDIVTYSKIYLRSQ